MSAELIRRIFEVIGVAGEAVTGLHHIDQNFGGSYDDRLASVCVSQSQRKNSILGIVCVVYFHDVPSTMARRISRE